jgi:restriction system protein
MEAGDTLLLKFPLPAEAIVLQAAILRLGADVTDGTIVEAVTIPWRLILEEFRRTPNLMYEIEPRKMEELIAGAYKEAKFDEVILTPRSGDLGRDIIATRRGSLQVRIFDQVKRYGPNHLVTAEEVRAAIGVLSSDRNMTKAIVTTTSDFAPKIATDPTIAPFVPYRLELRNGEGLLADIIKLLSGQLDLS